MPVIGTPVITVHPACAPAPCEPATPLGTLADAIQQNAVAGISSSSGDGQSMTTHSLQDQIAADKYLAAKRAAARPLGGMRVLKIRNGSAL